MSRGVDPFNPTLTAILPVGAVPIRLRAKVAAVLRGWGYAWSDVTFAGTAQLPPGRRWQSAGAETWVIAISVGSIDVGDEIDSWHGRLAGVQSSSFAGGLIPAIPYQAQVFEALGRRGGEHDPSSPLTPEEPGVSGGRRTVRP